MMTFVPRCVLLYLLFRVVGGGAVAQTQSIALPWSGHGHDAQHTALSQVASKPLQQILWQTPVDLAPQYSGGKTVCALRLSARDAAEHGHHPGEDRGFRWFSDRSEERLGWIAEVDAND